MAFDEKLNFYSSVAAEIATHPLSREVEFAVLHMDPLAQALRKNARRWVTSLGKLLNDSARESLMQLRAELEVCMLMCIVRTTVINLPYCPRGDELERYFVAAVLHARGIYYCLAPYMYIYCFLQGLSSDLTRSPDTLEDLKFVLSAIAKIRSMSLDVEMQYRCAPALHHS